MTECRIWYRLEQIRFDNEGFTSPYIMNEGKVVQKIVSETLDMKNSCVWVLIRYQVWGD